MIGKRQVQEAIEDDKELEEAVVHEIKKRRKPSVSPEAPITLQEKRARCRAQIEELMKQNKNLLVPWGEILAQCLQGLESQEFLPFKTVNDFIDGFLVDTQADTTALHLERFLKERGLDVYTPTMRGNLRLWWVQFASGPFDLEHNIPKLMKMAEEFRQPSP